MTELIQESTLAEYEAFVQSHPKGHFAQSSLWAKQKPAWKWRAIVSRGADGRIRGSIAFLIRTMPYILITMRYACRERGKDEFLPWDSVDMGVRRAYRWHEREQAYKAERSPDCRKQCTGCGALSLMPEGGKCDA